MEISIWSPDWGLASVDFECLSMISYAKFSGAPINVKETDSPFWSACGRLPVFRSNANDEMTESSKHVEIADLKEFIAHLRGKKFSADYNLNPKQHSEVRYIGIHVKQENLNSDLNCCRNKGITSTLINHSILRLLLFHS